MYQRRVYKFFHGFFQDVHCGNRILSDLYGVVYTAADIIYDSGPDGGDAYGKYAEVYVGSGSGVLSVRDADGKHSDRHCIPAGHGSRTDSGRMAYFKSHSRPDPYVCNPFTGQSTGKRGYPVQMCGADKNGGRMVFKNDPWTGLRNAFDSGTDPSRL